MKSKHTSWKEKAHNIEPMFQIKTSIQTGIPIKQKAINTHEMPKQESHACIAQSYMHIWRL